MPRPEKFPWTPEQIDRAKALAADGATGSEIAEALGTSRNAVIGKLHRLGLRIGGDRAGRPANYKGSWTAERTKQAKALFEQGHTYREIAALIGGLSGSAVHKHLHGQAIPLRRTAARIAGRRKPQQAREVIAAPAPARKPELPPAARLSPEDADLPLPQSRRVQLVDLRPGQCRWPLGDPLKSGFCFCAADVAAPGHSYCPSHRMLARGIGTPSERRATIIDKAVA